LNEGKVFTEVTDEGRAFQKEMRTLKACDRNRKKLHWHTECVACAVKHSLHRCTVPSTPCEKMINPELKQHSSNKCLAY